MEALKACPFCGGEPKIEDWALDFESGITICCSDYRREIILVKCKTRR